MLDDLPSLYAPPTTMRAAPGPRGADRTQRLLSIELDAERLTDRTIGELPQLVGPGDVVVLNDAATLPASLMGHLDRTGDRVELRLAGPHPGLRRSPRDGRAEPRQRFTAVLFGEGDFRDDTDRRPAPPRVAAGDVLVLGPLRAIVCAVDRESPRLLEVRFDAEGADFYRKLYAYGRPIQYRYVREPIDLADVQTGYAARPWSVELPSAGRPLRPTVLRDVRRAGATVVTLTHAAGLSATGDPALDARLPLPERFDIPAATVRAVEDATRVVAVGTSVVRALEGSVERHGRLHPGEDWTDLRIGPETRIEVVGALLTGAHDPSSSHYALLEAFAPPALLAAAVRHSVAHDYLGHEHGDSWWIA